MCREAPKLVCVHVRQCARTCSCAFACSAFVSAATLANKLPLSDIASSSDTYFVLANGPGMQASMCDGATSTVCHALQ